MSDTSELARRDFLAGAMALGAPGAALAAPARTSVAEERLHGRRALIIRNGRMRLGVLPGGGFIAEASLVSSDPAKSVNPMRVPHYPTIDPFTYDQGRHRIRRRAHVVPASGAPTDVRSGLGRPRWSRSVVPV